MPDGMRDLGPPRRIDVGQQVQLAAIVGTVAPTTQGGHAQGVSASSQRPGNKVPRIDTRAGSADDAVASGDGRALTIGGHHGRRSWQRRVALQLFSRAQLCAPAKRSALHANSFHLRVPRPSRHAANWLGGPGASCARPARAAPGRLDSENSRRPRGGCRSLARSARAPACPRNPPAGFGRFG